MEMEQFKQKFALNQKESRRLILKRGRTRLSKSEIALLRYLVTGAWYNGKKHPVQRTLKSMADHLGFKRIEYAKDRLNKLIAEKLLIPTGEENTFEVDCSPMQDWKTVRAVNDEKRKDRIKYERDYKRDYRAKEKEEKSKAVGFFAAIRRRVTIERVRSWTRPAVTASAISETATQPL